MNINWPTVFAGFTELVMLAQHVFIGLTIIVLLVKELVDFL